MRTSSRRTLPLFAAALSAAVLSSSPASAESGAKSKIRIERLSATGAAGQVSSGRENCVGGRKVSLFVFEGFITDKVAITESSSKGRWRVERSLDEGVYFAKVDAGKGCRYDNSSRKRLTISK